MKYTSLFMEPSVPSSLGHAENRREAPTLHSFKMTHMLIDVFKYS